jgi:hypothetical protein
MEFNTGQRHAGYHTDRVTFTARVYLFEVLSEVLSPTKHNTRTSK